MRFMMTHKIDEQAAAANPPSPEHMMAMGALIEELTNSGVLIATGGLLPSSRGARLRFTGGERTITDGPFTETKEVIGGFGIVDVGSLEEAIALATRFAALVGDTEIEIRQMWEDEPANAGAGERETAATA